MTEWLQTTTELFATSEQIYNATELMKKKFQCMEYGGLEMVELCHLHYHFILPVFEHILYLEYGTSVGLRKGLPFNMIPFSEHFYGIHSIIDEIWEYPIDKGFATMMYSAHISFARLMGAWLHALSKKPDTSQRSAYEKLFTHSNTVLAQLTGMLHEFATDKSERKSKADYCNQFNEYVIGAANFINATLGLTAAVNFEKQVYCWMLNPYAGFDHGIIANAFSKYNETLEKGE